MNYEKYKKAVKKMGGKEIATKKQYKKIQQRIKKRKKKGTTTIRTRAISKSLREAGLTEAEIKRLRDKKGKR